MLRVLVLIAGALLAGVAADAADPSAPGQAPTQFQDALHLVDVWLEAQAAFDRIPAVSAGIVVGDKLVWKSGYGAIDKDRKIAAHSDTIYGICSISKLFTSVAVMQLWETGKLSLDEDIGKLMPSFDIQRSVPDGGPITVRSLLTHS
jgi:CubicO group peptidase (beta-lactamase class C family)